MINIFISWGGERAHHVAKAHRILLPKLIQSVEPWMSDEDIEKGRSWSKELASILEESNFGIICLTPENKDSNWIHFEAGALAKHFEKAYVWTYLFDLTYVDIEQPLAEFQHTLATYDDTKKLARTINKLASNEGDAFIRQEHFDSSFDIWWKEFERYLQGVPESDLGEYPVRTNEDILSETLELVRDIWRSETPNMVGFSLPSSATINSTIQAAFQIAQERALDSGTPEPPRPMTYCTGDSFDLDWFFQQIRSYMQWPPQM